MTSFEKFSSNYFVGEMYVQPYSDDVAAVNRAEHEQINEELYNDEHSIVRTDNPVVMKVETTHFAVHGDEDIPTQTLCVPEETMDDVSIRHPPERKAVFLATPDANLHYLFAEP